MTIRLGAWLAAMTLGLTLAGFVSASKADDAVTATGTWKWEFTPQNGGDAIEVTLKLKQEGDKVTGTITGRNGNETEIKEGMVKDGEVTFQVVREFNGNTITQKYKGKLSKDMIKGKIERERDGEVQSRDWEAKRAS